MSYSSLAQSAPQVQAETLTHDKGHLNILPSSQASRQASAEVNHCDLVLPTKDCTDLGSRISAPPSIREVRSKEEKKAAPSIEVVRDYASLAPDDNPDPSAILEIPHLSHPNHFDAVNLAPFRCAPERARRHITPDQGNVRTVFALTHETGVPAATFWRMFVLCRGCDHVMTGDVLSAHICDLTGE